MIFQQTVRIPKGLIPPLFYYQTMGKKEHAPSAYRRIIKESKSGNVDFNRLIVEARALSDPYYVSLALFSLSINGQVETKLASNLRNQALELVEKENRPWRRAELIISICKLSKNMQMQDDIIKLIGQIPEPKARAEAISGTARHLGCGSAPELLKLAVQNEGHETDSCKPVIKFWAAECPEHGMIMELLELVDDPGAKIRLLGYLQLQLARAGVRGTGPMESAVKHALELPEKLELLKYLASQTRDIDSLEIIAGGLAGLDNPLEEAGLLSTLAGSADRAGSRELALDWFNSAGRCLNGLEKPGDAASIRLNLAIGYGRLGRDQEARYNYELALKGAEGNERLTGRIQKAMGKRPEKSPGPPVPRSARHVLALHDTYEGKFSSVHARMIAAAAPLCIAYGLNLALVDFPVDDLAGLVGRVSGDTNIGKGGRYLQELANENRIILTDSENLDSVGLPVATTSRPAGSKKINLEKAGKIARTHPRKRLCVIMGLGRKGLPKSLLASMDYHLEVTGSGIPLETTTFMGIMAQMMGRLK